MSIAPIGFLALFLYFYSYFSSSVRWEVVGLGRCGQAGAEAIKGIFYLCRGFFLSLLHKFIACNDEV